jgi:peptide/nickel transport system permease protein
MTSTKRKLVRRFLKRRLAVMGGILVLLVTATALLGPWLTSYDPVKMNIRGALQSSSPEHWLGTDHRGRDTLTRLAYGAGISLKVGLLATCMALFAGVVLGAVAGYQGGRTDIALMRAMDALMAFPGILLALALVAVLEPGITSLVIALGVVSIPRFSRIARAAVLQKKNLDYVQAARALGKGRWHILLSDILPNCLSPIIVQATLTLPSAILGEASLSFLGLGTPPPAPSWGRMLNEARGFMEINPELAVYPGVAIFLTILGFNLLGDGLRDVLDPRQS